ncbi:MAG: trehalose-phosphatase [Betaproteobacteria bacterium]
MSEPDGSSPSARPPVPEALPGMAVPTPSRPVRPMRPLLGPLGQGALVALVRTPALFAFDFDGTLAPIRPRPDDVHVSATIALRLEKLARLRPVAIVTGRQIADVRERLGFTPAWIIGNHGAEDEGDPESAVRALQALDALRARLLAREADLRAAGVMIEDKQQSLALHYRTAPDRAVASALIEDVLAGCTPALHVFGGKLVYNAVAADAPDKAVAVQRLIARAGVQAAFFAGDDLNDEPVFAAAEPGWVTVRIGCERTESAARFCIDGPHEMAGVLDKLLALIAG